MSSLAIRVLMDLAPTQRYHSATLAAIDHAGAALGLDLDVRVLSTAPHPVLLGMLDAMGAA